MGEKLGLNVVPLQLPMGVGEDFAGVIDLVTMQALTFDGDNGEDVARSPIPAEYAEAAAAARHHMLEALSMFNDELMGLLLEDKPVAGGPGPPDASARPPSTATSCPC